MRKSFMAVVLLTAAACGDHDTYDDRGYTKAPLEEAAVLVKAEEPTAMDRLGNPAYPDAPIIRAEEPSEETKEAKDGAPPGGTKAGSVPAGATAADVTEGQKIFTSTGNCFTCHGQNGAGTGMAPPLNDTKWINVAGDFASIQQVVNAGVQQPKEFPAPMPAKGGAALTEQQVKQVAAYVYSISHQGGGGH